jgi:NAD+ kinase
MRKFEIQVSKKNRTGKILLVYKKSYWELLKKDKKKILFLKKNHPSFIREILKNHDIHLKSLDKVVSVLEKCHCDYKMRYRAGIARVAKASLIITVGGDGTLLEAARYTRNIPLLSVNSNPRNSVAHFSACTSKDFESTFHQLGNARFPLKKISRLQISINRKKNDRLVLNDFLLAHCNPAALTRFHLKLQKKKVFFKSSGIWVATAAGSTAAMQSAGGKILPFFSKKWQYLVREPYFQNKAFSCNKIINGEEKLFLEVLSENTHLYMDGSHRSLPLEIGDRVTVAQSSWPLKIYCRKVFSPKEK